MSHPYKKYGESKHGRSRGRERFLEGGTVEPQRIEGPIEKLGVSTYRRELGRVQSGPNKGRFGVNPYIYPRTFPTKD